MKNLSSQIKNKLLANGAVLAGFADLTELPAEERRNLPVGISVAVKYPNNVIQGISKLPTQEYCDWYNNLNKQLDMLVELGAQNLQEMGFNAIAMTRAEIGPIENTNDTALPHKTVARLAGIGWIGKSALLVTDQYGSMIRVSSILTDAPLETATPIDQPKCGDCMICTNACPAGAISGKNWELGLHRDEFFDSIKCSKTAKERAMQGFGADYTICGKCIEVCPYTKKVFNKI